MRRLTRGFYERDALSVARDLIGCLFVHDSPEGCTAVRLVEVEAYRGRLDPGSHGYHGITRRTATMYGPPGRLYVYFTYGMHWCSNIVCGPDGVCEAVLLRALASGPARLARAMGIDGSFDGASLLRGARLWCAEDDVTPSLRAAEIAVTTRIGLSPGRGDDLPYRFVVPGHPFASRRR